MSDIQHAVLFLDIDGVLNSARYRDEHQNEAKWNAKMIDPVAAHRLAVVVRLRRLKIVISSTWRMNCTLDEIATAIIGEGNPDGFELQRADFIGMTDRSTDRVPSAYGAHNERGSQIRRWLDAHPKVTRFAIVDDDSDMGDLLPYLVNTSNQYGLLGHHIAAIHWLIEAQSDKMALGG